MCHTIEYASLHNKCTFFLLEKMYAPFSYTCGKWCVKNNCVATIGVVHFLCGSFGCHTFYFSGGKRNENNPQVPNPCKPYDYYDAFNSILWPTS